MTEPLALTTADLVRELSQRCDTAGGQTAWAAQHGVNRASVSDTPRR